MNALTPALASALAEFPAPVERRTIADSLLDIAAANAELFRGEDGQPYADVRRDGVRQTMRVLSTQFRDMLRHLYLKQTNKAPNGDALKTAVDTLAAKAQFEGEARPVSIRVAFANDKLYLDLGRPCWSAVEIDADGWRIVQEPPVRFCRPSGLRALPIPQSGGAIADLRQVLNLADDRSLILLVAWILAALRPTGPYPVLVLRGGPGAAKTSAAEFIRWLIDRAEPKTRRLSRDERDLFICADAVHVMAFDNISHLSDWQSDALCTLATGGGYATRALWTDSDERLFTACRPVILNGVGNFLTRADLRDRALVIDLAAIPDDKRREKAELIEAFEQSHPSILGALLDALVIGLQRAPTLHLPRKPRMADFAKWAVACEPGYAESGAFMTAWESARADGLPDDLEADPVAGAVVTLMQERWGPWSGTATELLEIINPEFRRRDLPKAGNALSSALKLATPTLARAGVLVTRGTREGHAGSRIIQIERTPETGGKPSSASSASRELHPRNGLGADDPLTMAPSALDPSSAASSAQQHHLSNDLGDADDADDVLASVSPDADLQDEEFDEVTL